MKRAKHRLHDIEVQEVSLVDRAANLRRFLLIKREPMNEPVSSPSGEDDHPPPADHPVTPALDALRAFTDSVEELSESPAEESEQRLHNLAAQLRDLAVRIAPQADGAPVHASTERSEVAALTRAVSELRDALASVRKAEDDGGTGSGPPGKRPASLREQLMAIAQSLRGLAAGLSEQDKRLRQLEKNVGLPHSAPEPRTTSMEESWPLDLNRPFDRDSVSKKLSFFDL